MKKRIFTITFLLITTLTWCQIGIGKSYVDGDGILDFSINPIGGIILPAVTTLPTGAGATNGTLLYDYNNKNIKIRVNNSWKAYTIENGNNSQINLNTSTDIGDGIIIGNSTSSADGVLILESSSKALILHKIDGPHLNISNPYPGTICYDTYNKSLAVFDGSKWYFWK